MKNLLNVSSKCDIKYNYILELHVMLMSNVIIIFIYNIDYLDKFSIQTCINENESIKTKFILKYW